MAAAMQIPASHAPDHAAAPPPGQAATHSPRFPPTSTPVRQTATGLEWLHAVLAGPTGLQPALRRVIESLPKRAANAHDLAKLIKADSGSVWRLWESAYAQTPEKSAATMSGQVALSRLLDKLVAHGGDPAAAKHALVAFKQFEHAVERHAGDAETLKMMIERSGEDALTPQDKHAKLLFDAARYRLKMQAAAMFIAIVRSPSNLEGIVDCVRVHHTEQLWSLAPVPMYLLSSGGSLTKGEGPTLEQARLRPRAHVLEQMGAIQNASVPEGAQPIPCIESVTVLNGRSLWKRSYPDRTEGWVSGGNVGREWASDFCVATYVPLHTPEFPHESVASITQPPVPVETLVFELYADEREVSAGFAPVPCLFDPLHAPEGSLGSMVSSGPLLGDIEHYRPGRTRPDLPEVARYGQIVEAIQTKPIKALSELHLFRWRVPYPMVGMNYALVCDQSAI